MKLTPERLEEIRKELDRSNIGPFNAELVEEIFAHINALKSENENLAKVLLESNARWKDRVSKLRKELLYIATRGYTGAEFVARNALHDDDKLENK